MRPSRWLVSLLIIWITVAAARAGVAGHWQGALNVGVSLRLAFSVQEKEGALRGTLRSLDQGGQEIALDLVTENQGAVRFEVRSIGGIFAGKLSADGQELAGTWSQGVASFPLKLKRTEQAAALVRPQEPKPPLPYRELEMTAVGPAKNVELAGTFSIPEGAGPFPAVVLVSGSGPQDRDEALMGHRPFAVLADHLARHGIAVLRYDDRGVGKSKGDFEAATTPDFVEDARAMLGWLRQRKEVDPRKIGIVGHSEGGIVAPMVAARDREVGFIVLLAGVGVPMKELLLRQIADANRAEGLDEKRVAERVDLTRKAFELMGEKADAAEKRLRELIEGAVSHLTPEERAQAPGAETLLAQSLAQLRSPWMRWVLGYDPAPVLREVRCPVLAINGAKDVQVAAKENLGGIAKALAAGGNREVKTAILPGLNHLFQTCKTGSPKEYGEIEETFAPAALQVVSDWILAR